MHIHRLARRSDIVSVMLTLFLLSYLFLRLSSKLDVFITLLGVLFGLCLADTFTGLVHWFADSYGNTTSTIGKLFIASFREHHRDEKAITRHDFFELNGASCLVTLPLTIILCLVSLPVLLHVTGAFLVVSILLTNQFHRWAHTDVPPLVVRFFQNLRIILPKMHHKKHHKKPFMMYYCVTTGWMNHVLRPRFYRLLENVIYFLTRKTARQYVIRS